MIRVIAGTFRGRKLQGPSQRGIRPAMGIVKEHMFGVLQQQVPDATVLDLFCGTGSLGIEAISRGAGHVTFVDSWNVALQLVRDNLQTLAITSQAAVVSSDVPAFLKRLATTPPDVDLIFLDPPFRYDAWADLLSLVTGVMRPETTILVLQHLPDISPTHYPAGLDCFRHKKFGANQISMFRLHAA